MKNESCIGLSRILIEFEIQMESLRKVIMEGHYRSKKVAYYIFVDYSIAFARCK